MGQIPMEIFKGMRSFNFHNFFPPVKGDKICLFVQLVSVYIVNYEIYLRILLSGLG